MEASKINFGGEIVKKILIWGFKKKRICKKNVNEYVFFKTESTEYEKWFRKCKNYRATDIVT